MKTPSFRPSVPSVPSSLARTAEATDAKVSSSSTEGALKDATPDVDVDAMMTTTHCPFIRTAMKADLLAFDGRTAPIDQLKKVLGDDFGRVGAFFARLNHKPEGGGSFLFRTRYDPLHLVGSKGDHPGDTGILSEQGFSEEAFQRVVAHSSDGETMTASDFAAAIAEANRRDEDAGFVVDRSKSAGEFALLLEGFGQVVDGDKRISIADMRLLFEDNLFPPKWEQSLKEASAAGWTKLTLHIGAKALTTRGAPAPMRSMSDLAQGARMQTGATGDAFDGASYAADAFDQRFPPAVGDALAGAMTGACPAMPGGGTRGLQAVKPQDIAASHDAGV